MQGIEVIGLAAGLCTSAASVPQIVTTIQKKKAADVSPWMFMALLADNILWTWYGFRKPDLPIAATNALAILLDIMMLTLRFKYGGWRLEVRDQRSEV